MVEHSVLTDLRGKDTQRDYVILENINTLKYTVVQQEFNHIWSFFSTRLLK